MKAVSFLPLGLQVGTHRQIQEIGGEVLQLRLAELQLAQKVVVGQHGGYGGGDADGSGDQRLADGSGDHVQAGGLGLADAFQRMHDAPHRAEQPDERRGAADAGEHGQAGFQHLALLADLLAQGALQDGLDVVAEFQRP